MYNGHLDISSTNMSNVVIICSRIGIDATRNTVNLSFKHNLSGDLLATQETQNPFMQERWI